MFEYKFHENRLLFDDRFDFDKSHADEVRIEGGITPPRALLSLRLANLGEILRLHLMVMPFKAQISLIGTTRLHRAEFRGSESSRLGSVRA